MISSFGYMTLALAFLLSFYGLVILIFGLIQESPAFFESARRALVLIFPLSTAGILVLVFLLLTDRFDVAYVYSVSSREMPAYLKLTALWGGQEGSLLFWSWLLSGFSLGFSSRKIRKESDLFPWAMLVAFILLIFFLGLNVFLATPFERFWHFTDGGRVLSVFQPRNAWTLTPGDGQGLNPLLRHPGMIWHPPALYLGFVGFLIPFGLAAATLITKRRDGRWIELSRTWILIAWVFLSLGLVLGMRWAYDVLGWGGYWGWDPVEIAALMPWLSATALIHTALLQKKANGFQRWNLSLIILTFGLVIFGTFITRSGVLSSVHTFAGSNIGPAMFVIMGITSIGGLGLLIYRWRDFGPSQEIEFGFSREVLTLFSNLVLLSILMVCFLGVVYPIFSDLLTGTQVTVGPAWYERITGPLFTLLLSLMGLCPLAAWGLTRLNKIRQGLTILLPLSLLVPLLIWLLGGVNNFYALAALWLAGLAAIVISWEYINAARKGLARPDGRLPGALWVPFRRNHRRYGGMLVHLGIVLMSLGIIGLEGLQQETQLRLERGESASIGAYQYTFEGIERFTEAETTTTQAVLTILYQGQPEGALYPSREVYSNLGMAVTIPGVKSNLSLDHYAILVDWQPELPDEATFRIFVNPLVNWLWIGSGVLTLGTIIAVLPKSRNGRL
ncbi:MAG: cytochrome c-type biogenesis CcmF C-terminal domain-containing protein [Brevefilum sp.]|nr:cytochrome c-type biogenesis CcmF C-terminal domain-containing protein [Brevefilum sp.]